MDQLSTESPALVLSQPVTVAPLVVGAGALNGKKLEPSSPAEQTVNRSAPTAFRRTFTVQFCLAQPDIALQDLTQALQALGECLAVEGDDQAIRVHLQAQDPGAPLSFAVEHGHVTAVRIENVDAEVGEGEARFAPPVESEPADEIALAAVSTGAGFTAILREFGVDAIVAADGVLNPSQDELAEVLRSLPNRRILFLPNNSDVLLTANHVAEILAGETPSRTVLVANTKTMPQVIAALHACSTAPHDLAASCAQIQERCAQIDTGVVTQALCAAEFDGIAVEVGDFIGLHDGRLVTRNGNLDDVVLTLLEQMAADDSRTITMYYSDFISAEAAENLKETVRTRYADQAVALAYGGQAHNHYILSTE